MSKGNKLCEQPILRPALTKVYQILTNISLTLVTVTEL